MSGGHRCAEPGLAQSGRRRFRSATEFLEPGFTKHEIYSGTKFNSICHCETDHIEMEDCFSLRFLCRFMSESFVLCSECCFRFRVTVFLEKVIEQRKVDLNSIIP